MSQFKSLGDQTEDIAEKLYRKHGEGTSLDDIEQSLEDANQGDPYGRRQGEELPCERCNRQGRTRRGLFCSCNYGSQKQEEYTRRERDKFSRAGLPRRLRQFSLDSWDEKCGGEEGKSIPRRLVQEVIDTGYASGPNGKQRPGLFVHGENGLGKSGLMAGLLKRMYRKGWPVLWIKWDDLIDDVQATYGGGSEGMSTAGIISTAQNLPALFLDDLGEPFRPSSDYRVSEDARSITWRVISARHENMWPTFITSNHDGLSKVSDQFSPRIADRIMELCTVAEMKGGNLRHPSNQ